MILTVATIVVAAFATTTDAQVFRGRGRVSRVVVVGGFYSPFWIDPWYALDYQWGLYPPYYPYYRRYLAPEASVKFEVKPKEKRVGLFKGELWIDAKTNLPVRESGQFVKNPSIFLKKVEFTRDYELKDGVAIPKHIESRVDTRLVGVTQIDINYENIHKAEGEDSVDEARTAQ